MPVRCLREAHSTRWLPKAAWMLISMAKRSASRALRLPKIEVFSIYGAKIAEQTGAQQVALNAAAEGLYLVRVADAKGKISVEKVQKK